MSPAVRTNRICIPDHSGPLLEPIARPFATRASALPPLCVALCVLNIQQSAKRADYPRAVRARRRGRRRQHAVHPRAVPAARHGAARTLRSAARRPLPRGDCRRQVPLPRAAAVQRLAGAAELATSTRVGRVDVEVCWVEHRVKFRMEKPVAFLVTLRQRALTAVGLRRLPCPVLGGGCAAAPRRGSSARRVCPAR